MEGAGRDEVEAVGGGVGFDDDVYLAGGPFRAEGNGGPRRGHGAARRDDREERPALEGLDEWTPGTGHSDGAIF